MELLQLLSKCNIIEVRQRRNIILGIFLDSPAPAVFVAEVGKWSGGS